MLSNKQQGFRRLKTKINHDKFLELIERLQKDNTMAELAPFFPKFIELGDLMGHAQQSTDAEEKRELWMQFEKRRNSIEEEFVAVLKRKGLQIDEFKSHIENPANYSPDEWQNIQEIQGEIEGLIEKKAIRQSGKKKQPNWA